jgi:hypothetical protein
LKNVGIVSYIGTAISFHIPSNSSFIILSIGDVQTMKLEDRH